MNTNSAVYQAYYQGFTKRKEIAPLSIHNITRNKACFPKHKAPQPETQFFL